MIEPLALTRGFLPTLEKYLGQEPVRKLDNHSMDMNDPGSFMSCYDFSDNPKEALRNNKTIRKHFMFSFCGIMSLYNLLTLSTQTDLQIIEKQDKKPFEYFVILTGTVYEWHESCLKLCVPDTDIDLLADLNTVILTIERSEIREIFKSSTKNYIDNNLFTLE